MSLHVASQLHRRQADRAELIDRLSQLLPETGVLKPVPGMLLRRESDQTELGHGTSFPSFCVIAQGAKELRLGDRRFTYDVDSYLIASNTLPFASRVAEATAERPYLGVIITLDSALVSTVIADSGLEASARKSEVTGMDTAPLDDDLLDAVVRLVRLCDSPETIGVLAPLIQREIIFRLLIGGQGDRVRQIAAMGEGSRIAEAIVRMRRDFAEPLRIEELAADLGMSVSSFHHRFKEATAMSPLQFHKQLRLQEARRLMLGEQLDATTAGSRVGYADMAYFNRDYKRLFGAPPIRDVHRLRQTSTETSAVNI